LSIDIHPPEKKKAQICEATDTSTNNITFRRCTGFHLSHREKPAKIGKKMAISGIRVRGPAEDMKAMEESPKKLLGFSRSAQGRRRYEKNG
jgi:hypothetical protein